MITKTTSTTLAAFALIAAASIMPASAQTQTYPAGTDCSKLVGNSKTECANQAKSSGAPDNSNNPDAGTTNNSGSATTGTNAGTDTSPAATTTTPAKDYRGKDCSALVGNDKTECANQNKNEGTPDNSNNPAKSDPAQSN